jgi:hypothetical protein
MELVPTSRTTKGKRKINKDVVKAVLPGVKKLNKVPLTHFPLPDVETKRRADMQKAKDTKDFRKLSKSLGFDPPRNKRYPKKTKKKSEKMKKLDDKIAEREMNEDMRLHQSDHFGMALGLLDDYVGGFAAVVPPPPKPRGPNKTIVYPPNTMVKLKPYEGKNFKTTIPQKE